jgi:hypothetical protein
MRGINAQERAMLAALQQPGAGVFCDVTLDALEEVRRVERYDV